MQALLPRFRAAHTQVLGVSVDSMYCHANWARDLGGVSFPLLADFHPKGEVARSYGAPARSMFTQVVIPGSMPMVMTGARLASEELVYPLDPAAREHGASAESETPDQISQYWGTSQAQSVGGFQSVFNASKGGYRLPDSFFTTVGHERVKAGLLEHVLKQMQLGGRIVNN